MGDFTLLSVAKFLNQKVTTYDSIGALLADTGEYQRHGAETVFVFAEFLHEKGLLNPGVEVSRRPDLKLQFSDLTEEGQRIAKFALDKWMRATDRAGVSKAPAPRGLERHWSKFLTT